jgi:tetratricopeptide (TPR) repeat protein
VAGGALERLADWLPPDEMSGLRLTEAAAAVAGANLGERDRAGFVSLDTPTGTQAALSGMLAGSAAPLVGRDSLIEAAALEGTACFAGACPTLTTLVGETGLGKSRALEALAARFPTIEILESRARPPSAGDPEVVLRDLLRDGLELEEGAVSVAEIQRACIERLGREQGEAAWPAVALVLGSLDDTDARVRPILDAPGALRQTLARAAGSALRALGQAGPVAILVDDAHWADQASLDALEMCTLDGSPARVWVCVAAAPSLLELRPLWGDRAGRAGQYALGPLPPGPMVQLAVELLRPVEFVPEPVIARLLEMTQGNPLYMVELVQALRASGAIRRHRGTEEWYVAADEIPHVAPGAPASALAGHAIAALPAHLAALAELCAVFGDELAADEVDAVTRSLPTDEASLDPAFGLPRLVRFGLLRRAGQGYFAFRHPMVREALEDRIAPARRRQLHRVVLEHLMHTGDRSRSVLERLARHAAGCGESGLAADALIELAEEDRRRHRYVDAETHYSAALDQLTAGDPRREPILAGRGKVRYRLQRFQEALDDLTAARALAEARGDDAATADLLLEEATVLDWAHRWSESAARVDEVRPLVDRLASALVAARFHGARGRTFWRQERIGDAIDALSHAVALGRDAADHESATVALLLLGPALTSANRLDESEARFEEVIQACRERGDLLHLCVAYNNRLLLWAKRQRVDRATDDQERAIELARELGFSQLELASTHNLAQLFYWRGLEAQALPLAVRSAELVERLALRLADAALLLARIHCARGEHEQAASQLAWVRRHVPEADVSPLNTALVRLVELQIQDDLGEPVASEEWQEMVNSAAVTAVVDEQVEILHIAARRSLARGRTEDARRWISLARQISGHSAIWQQRLADVAAETTAS